MNKNNVKNNIKELIDQFGTFREKSYKTYCGPSSYFHLETINLVKQCKTKEEYQKLLSNKVEYIEKIYATLASWGMQRMGSKGMVEFEDFTNTIRDNIIDLEKLFNSRIESMTEEEKEILGRIFLKLKTMKSNSQLVANSKVLHHLLPNLVPPMDRTHTLKFFNKTLPTSKQCKTTLLNEKEKGIFIDILSEFKKLYDEIPKDYFKIVTNFDTSIPKIIDNAIMGKQW